MRHEQTLKWQKTPIRWTNFKIGWPPYILLLITRVKVKVESRNPKRGMGKNSWAPVKLHLVGEGGKHPRKPPALMPPQNKK